jgi:hypothetical protein
MRTSGGAGASRWRHRDAKPGAVHPLTVLLFTLLLLCSAVEAESASAASQQQRDWNAQLPPESPSTVGADGIATSRGVGRRRSDGLSITRSIPVATGIAPDAATDDQAIKFSPGRVDMGRMETCVPDRFSVGVENRGRVSVRLDGADFTHEGFSLANDVRGIRLDPGDRFNVEFVFLPRQTEPNGVDAHLRVVTTSGLFSLPISSTEVVLNRYGVSSVQASVPAGVRYEQSLQFVNPLDRTIRITEVFAMDDFVHLDLLNGSSWIGPRWPGEEDEKEALGEVPGEYNPGFDYARRVNRGAWDMPARTTSPLIQVTVQTHAPGTYFTFVHVAAEQRRLLVVPVRITALKPGIHIEPKELDLGMLTDYYENEPRELYFSLHNAGLNPIQVLELKVLESNMVVSAQLRGSTVIPPQTRVYRALAVQLLVNKDIVGGDCVASLLLKTNASSSELGQRKLRLYGQVIKGNLSFQLNETQVGVMMPLERVFSGNINDDTEEADDDGAEEEQETLTTSLVSRPGDNASEAIMAGTSKLQRLRLWNHFDCPVELQRVWLADEVSESQEVTVHKFTQGIVSPGAALPKILLQITPALQQRGGFLAPRSYSVMVETNATLHRIQVHVHHSILSLQSSRGLQSYSVSGYYSGSSAKSETHNVTQSCLPVPKNGVIPTTTPRIDGGKGSTATQSVRICRSLLFDLEKMASHRARTEAVEVRNHNPVPVVLNISGVPESDAVGVSVRAEVSVVQSVAPHGMHGSQDGIGAGTQLSNITYIVSAGGSFVLQPASRVVFHVEIHAKEALGELTVPVLFMTTPAEELHLYARFVSVEGTVEPVKPAIILPSMFPGRTEIIHLQYRNTFEHLVTPLMATASNSNLQLIFMRETLGPKQVANVLDLLFSPVADSKCSNAMFLADCLLPQPEAMDDQTCEPLSYYGELVDEHDLDALRRRDAFWSGVRGTENQSTVEVQVYLETDIMEEVAEVTITAQLERPVVTVPTGTLPSKEFALTELLELSYIFVHVRNPSNISIQMELALAEADQNLFYNCEHGSYVVEALGGTDVDRGGNDTENSTAICLTEWRAAAKEAVALHKDSQEETSLAPFFFQKSVIQVPPGAEAELGPLYYLPSKVEEVATTVFVRNDLSHIEPVPLLARSGKGELKLLVGDATDSSKPTKARFVVAESDDATEQDEALDYDGILRFSMAVDDKSTDYTQTADILLANTGPFGLTVRSVAVEAGHDEASWMSWTGASAVLTTRKDFNVDSDALDQWNEGHEGGLIVLPPNKSARIRISFCASCVVASVASWLVIDTSDSTRRIRLEGRLTKDAAFSCLRSRMPPRLRSAIETAWLLAAIVAAITVFHSLLITAYEVWTMNTVSKTKPLRLAVNGEDLEAEGKSPDDVAGSNMEDQATAAPRMLESVNRLLAEMERTAFAAPVRVSTPAVAELLERRHKGLYGDGPSENAALNNDGTSRYDGDTNASAAANDDEALMPPAAPQISSPSASCLQDVQEEVSNTTCNTNADESVPVTSAQEHASSVINASEKLLDGTADDNPGDVSSDAASSESSDASLGSAKSSHSTIAQPDAEDPSRSATEFPKPILGDQPKAATGSDLPIGKIPPEKVEGPFEAFKSLSARWRTEDWQDDLSNPAPTLSGTFQGLEDWNDTLQVRTLGQGLGGATAGYQSTDSAGPGSRSAPGSFIGSSSGLFLDGFSAFAAPPALPLATAPKTSAKKTPPGFTPADAKPLEARAAFERLRSSSGASSATRSPGDGFSEKSLFASKLPLFGPALPPTDHVMLGGAGRIGSGRSKVLRDLNASPQ